MFRVLLAKPSSLVTRKEFSSVENVLVSSASVERLSDEVEFYPA